MALIDDVRRALRIKSEAFDAEIKTLIKACKIDMAMAGVSKISEDDPTFMTACMQYCKANFGQDTEVSTRERWEKCYKALRDPMALSKEYGVLQNSEEKQEVAPVQQDDTEDGYDDV